MRQIRYVTRSIFLSIIETNLINIINRVNEEFLVRVELDTGGYNGDVEIFIDLNNDREFQTNWSGRDVTRFPQRIRSAATALRKCGFAGRFRIVHEDGLLEIRSINKS